MRVPVRPESCRLTTKRLSLWDHWLQVHLQLLYGSDVRLPPAVRVLTDYLTRTQLFLCNGMGNFVLRVLAFVA